jgi:hypothetical protein
MVAPIPPKPFWFAVCGLLAVALVTSPPRGDGPSLPEGTVLVAALEHSISTVDARPGDAVELRTVHTVRLPDGGEIPLGTPIRGEVMHVRSGRGRQVPELLLQFSVIDIAEDRYAIASTALHVRGRQRSRRSAATPGAAGVALGSGATIATDGRELVLPAGRRLTVRLTAPAEVRYRVPTNPRLVD